MWVSSQVARNGQQRGKSYFMAMRKTFLHPIARFAAHLIIKIPPMEENDLQPHR
jgi:hypothetical protein